MQSSTWLCIAAGFAAFGAVGPSAAVVIPAAVHAQAVTPPPPPRTDPAELHAYVVQFTDANPRDCGQYVVGRAPAPATAKDLQRSLACAYAAAKAGKAFWTVKRQIGLRLR